MMMLVAKGNACLVGGLLAITSLASVMRMEGPIARVLHTHAAIQGVDES